MYRAGSDQFLSLSPGVCDPPPSKVYAVFFRKGQIHLFDQGVRMLPTQIVKGLRSFLKKTLSKLIHNDLP